MMFIEGIIAARCTFPTMGIGGSVRWGLRDVILPEGGLDVKILRRLPCERGKLLNLAIRISRDVQAANVSKPVRTSALKEKEIAAGHIYDTEMSSLIRSKGRD